MFFLGFFLDMSVEKTAKLLNLLNRPSSDRILDYIDAKDPPLAKEIRSSLFRFEDLLRFEDRDLKILLQEIPNPMLPIALKGVDEKLVAKILDNMSTRAGDILKEDLAMSGPKARTEVEADQKTITATARLLLDQGKIFAPWLSGEDKIIY